MLPTMRTFSWAMIVFAGLSFASACRKQLEPTTAAGTQAGASITAAVVYPCYPVVFGATVGYPGMENRWVTFMQKWYGSNGKPAYLKANFFTDMNDFVTPEQSIVWGELLYYNNNQVYLRDGNDTVMRVTIDAQQRPLASYYKYNHFPQGSYLADTSYYHFNFGRLDTIDRLFVDTYGGISKYERYTFFYDRFGNVVKVNRWTPASNNTMTISYNYVYPIYNLVSPHQVTIPFKLLEYMDLLRLPALHQIKEITGLGNNWQYLDYSMNDYLVNSYSAAGSNQRIFYNGWQCSGGTTANAIERQQMNLKSVEDFFRVYRRQ